MQMYHALAEVDDRSPLTRDDVDRLMEILQHYHGSPGMSPRGFRDAALAVPGETLAQAAVTVTGVMVALYGAPVVALEVLTEKEFNAREGWETLPELVSVTEAAELLGITRQAVLDRISRNTLPAQKIGRDYALPRAAVVANRNT